MGEKSGRKKDFKDYKARIPLQCTNSKDFWWWFYKNPNPKAGSSEDDKGRVAERMASTYPANDDGVKLEVMSDMLECEWA